VSQVRAVALVVNIASQVSCVKQMTETSAYAGLSNREESKCTVRGTELHGDGVTDEHIRYLITCLE